MSRRLGLLKITLGALGCWLILNLTPALGAERIVFRGWLDLPILDLPFYISIKISKLETYANKGIGLQNLLTIPYNSKGDRVQTLIELRRLFKYLEREEILELFEEVIQTESRSKVDSAKAIRAAIILAAADDSSDFTALEVLRHFPTNSIMVDLAKGPELNSKVLSKLEEFLEIARANNNRLEEGITLLGFGSYYAGMNQPYKAIQTSKRALEIFEKEEVDFDAGKALTLTTLGAANYLLDKNEIALMYYQKAQEIYQERESNQGTLSAAENLNFSLPEVVQLIDQYAGEEILYQYIRMID